MSGVFISYRRGHSSAYAGRLYDRLATEHGRARVFMDVDAIDPGVDFAEKIKLAIADSVATLVVIGDDWSAGGRLENPADFVRMEVEEALRHGGLVVPVLVGGARLPAADELPASMRPLLAANAVALRDERWSRDVEDLAESLRRTVPRAPRRRWWPWAAGAAVAAAAVAAVFVFVLRGGDDLQVLSEPQVSGYAIGSSLGGGQLWVVSQEQPNLSAVDVRTSRVSAGPPLGKNLSAVAAAGDALWVGDYGADDTDGEGTVLLVEAGQVKATMKTGDPFAVVADDTSVWVLDQGGELDRIDVATRHVTRTKVKWAPFDLALADGIVWAIDVEAGMLHSFDARTGVEDLPAQRVPARPFNIAATGKYVWIVTEQGTLVRVPAAGGAQTTEPVGGEGTRWVAADDHSVWVADEQGNVRQLDPESLEVVGSLRFGEGTPFDIALDGDTAWVLRARSRESSSVMHIAGN